MKQLSRYITLITLLTGAIMAFGDRIATIPYLPPAFTHYWPFVLALAVFIHQSAAIYVTWMRDSANASQGATDQSAKPPVNSVLTKVPFALLFLNGAALFRHAAYIGLCSILGMCCAGIMLGSSGCAGFQSAETSASSDISKGLAWAQTPNGQTLLNGLNDIVQVVAANGGMKSKSNAANVSTALRSLETGSLPSATTLTSAITTYTGKSAPPMLVSSIVGVVSAAPSAIGGLEAAAQTLDKASSSGQTASTYPIPLMIGRVTIPVYLTAGDKKAAWGWYAFNAGATPR